MASLKTHAIVTVVLALVTCLTMARELHHIDHLAPESAPSNLSANASLAEDARDLGPSPLTYTKENCGQGGNPGQYGGSGGGMPYGGAGSGGRTPYGGAGGAGSGGGMQYSTGAGSGEGMPHSAAGSGSSFVYPVALSALVLVAGLIYF